MYVGVEVLKKFYSYFILFNMLILDLYNTASSGVSIFLTVSKLSISTCYIPCLILSFILDKENISTEYTQFFLYPYIKT